MTLVLWSGGCDSTLVLYDLAREASAKKPVRALSIEHHGVSAWHEQRRAQGRILARMKRDGLPVEHATMMVTRSGSFMCAIQAGLSQPPIWLPTATLFLEEKEDLYAGYIREDDVWHYRSQLYSLFGSLMTFQHREGNLILPLEWTYKSEVLSRLKKAKLLDLVWWCEEPKAGKPCGRCIECRRHEAATWALALEESRVQANAPPAKGKKKKRKKR